MVQRGEVLHDKKIKELMRAGVILNADELLVNPGSLDSGHGEGLDQRRKYVDSRIVLEVRAIDIPVALRDGQRIAHFQLHRMLERPEKSYMSQRSTNYGDLKSILPIQFKKD